MPNEQYLEEFVSPAGFKQLQELQTAVAATNKDLQKGIQIAAQYTAAIGGSRGLAEFNRNIAQAAIAQERLAQAQIRTEAAQIRLTQAQDRATSSQQRNTQRTEEQARAYAALDAQHKKLLKDAQDLGVVFGTNSQQFRDAAKAANELDKKLKEIDTALGRNNRHVGDYARGWNGLGNSINQITRELPAFTVSAQTGFLAISNNLPILFDQIANTRREIAAMRAEGQKVPGLFSQLTTAIFSWGTALSLGVTLLTIYGKDVIAFVGALFKGKKALDEFAESQKDLNEAFKSTDFSKSIRNVEELRINIDLAKKGFLDKEKVLKQYNTTIGQTTGEVKNLDEAEQQLQKNASAFIKMTLYKAAAQVALDNASKKAVEAATAANKTAIESANALDKSTTSNVVGPLAALDQITRVFTLGRVKLTESEKVFQTDLKRRGSERRKVVIDEATKEQTLQEKIAADFQKRAAKIAKDNNFDFFGSQFEDKSKALKEQPTNYGTTLDDIIKQSEAIFKNDQNSYEKRLGALDSYIKNSQLLAEGDEGKLNLIKLNGEKERTKIIDQANKEQLKLITESEKARVQELLSANNDQFEALEAIREKDTVALEARYNAGKIDKEDYEKELFNIESSYAKDRIAIQIETLAQIVEIQRSDLAIGIGTNEDLKKSEKELSALRIQLAQLQRKEVKQTSEERIKAAEKELSAIKQLTEKSLEFGKALIDGVYTRRLNALSDESAALDKKKQQDIENVNDSVLTEQQKADQIAIINARAESQQSAIDERIRQQKIKQARADKAQAIAQIIIQTALAQIKVIGQAGILGFVFSPLITALGALSLATAIATPIPKFAVGTEHSPEGLAWVGERGTEGRINPDGTTELTPNKPTLTYLEKGTKIIPNHKLYNKMAKPDKSNFAGAEQVPWSQLIQEQRQTTKVLKKAFGDQSVNSTQVTKGGWKATQTKMSNLQKHIKRNLS